MLVTLGDHPQGDFGFCRYKWTQDERQRYLRDGQPPMILDGLPANQPLVPLYYYTRAVEMTFLGPQMLSSEYRRLRSSDTGRLIFYDLFGFDELEASYSLVVIPSDDIRLTPSQERPLVRNLGIDKDDTFAERTPLLSHTLVSGLVLSDYSLQTELDGTCSAPWDAAWNLLDAFSRAADSVSHPKNHQHSAQRYRSSVNSLNERLAQEHEHIFTQKTSDGRTTLLDIV